MNDLDLHSRLTALADDLAPDADPYAQIADARGLHRRRQRTRLGIAGAAVAVALVAVGVPTAVGTLLSSPDGDAARPTPSSDVLRGPANAVRARLARPESGTVPDPELGRSCSGAAEVVEVDSRYRPVRQPGGWTNTACLWSTDGTGTTPAEDRVDLELSSGELDADRLREILEDGSCPSTTLFPERGSEVLRVCDADGQRRWELFVLDDDGTGGWAMTAAVGEDLPAGFTVAAGSVAALWGVVLEFDDRAEPPSPGNAPEISQLNREFNELVNAVDADGPPALAGTGDWACPGGTAELEEALAVDLTEGGVRLSLPPQPVCWWSAGPTPTTDAELAGATSLTVLFEGGVDALPEGWWTQGSLEVAENECLATGELVGGTVHVEACSLDAVDRYTVRVVDDGGTGLWTLTVQAPPDSPVDPSEATLALVALADRLW